MIHIDLGEQVRRASAALLQPLLVDGIHLRLAVKQAHWTIRGPGFIALHTLLDQLAARLDDHVDEMAERMTALRQHPDGTSGTVASSTRLAPYPSSFETQNQHIEALAVRVASFGTFVRSGGEAATRSGDQGTADLLTAISRACDKDLWLLDAHLA